jgi:hypothetical protein
MRWRRKKVVISPRMMIVERQVMWRTWRKTSTSDKEGGNTAVVVEVTPIMETNWNRFNGVCVSLRYTFTRMLGVISFGLTSKHFLPVLKPGGASGLDKDKRKKGARASIRKLQEEQAVIELVVSTGRGISQQNWVTFVLMAQNKDNADQEICDWRK